MITIRIYKDMPQGKLVVNSETPPRVVHKRSSSIILYAMLTIKIYENGEV